MTELVPHRILCIEDDARLRRLLVEDLTEAGYDVIAADCAMTGLEAFFTNAPALVLCDIRMPGMSGFDLFGILRQLDGTIFDAAFIFLTALADRDNELHGRRLGADDYITKPVDYEILREVIRIRLGGRPPRRRPGPLAPAIWTSLAAWIKESHHAPPGGLAGTLQEHMSGCSRPAPRPGDVPANAGAFSGMVDGMPIGIVILDGEGTVHYANESAATVLGRPRGELPGTRANPKLAAFARHHARTANGPDYLSAQRLELGTEAEPVTAIARMGPPAPGGDRARVTVLLPALPKAQPVFGELLHALFGLTPAERGLATALSAGGHLGDIATDRGVALPTVRAQLKSVFSKVGVTSQSDLVRTLLTLQMAAGCAGT